MPSFPRFDLSVGAREALAERFATVFERAARDAIAARGRFACAVAGGSVAEAFLPRLAGAAVDWPRLHVFFADERAVPLDHPDSNAGLARRLWLDHVSVEPAHVHLLYQPGLELDQAAVRAECDLVSTLGAPPRLDLVLLGMGSDGHVCSLFPGHPALRERRFVLAVHDSPKPPPERLTLGLAALAQAAEICVAAFGAEKAAAVQQALEAPASALPVALAVRSGPRVRFLLDPAAAGRLGPAASAGG
jgi:6-phosphogluconolactonase